METNIVDNFPTWNIEVENGEKNLNKHLIFLPIFCPVQAVFSIPLSPSTAAHLMNLPVHSFIQFIAIAHSSLSLPYARYCSRCVRHLAVTKKIGTLPDGAYSLVQHYPRELPEVRAQACTTANSSWLHVATELLKCGLCIREVLVGEIDSKLMNRYTGEFWKMRRGTKFNCIMGWKPEKKAMLVPVIRDFEVHDTGETSWRSQS